MSRYADHKAAKEIISTIDSKRENYLIIHYSCESFLDKFDGKSPRITSIAVKKFDDGQTDLFAIHKVAEINKIPFDDIESDYDKLEKEMLEKFFAFVKTNEDKIWIHWNMRDSNYGFKALEHRYEVLGGTPTLVNDRNKIDLARLFIKMYGKGYASNPRIKSLAEQNKIHPKDILFGKEESDAFENKEFIKLSFSTASKVDLFSNFLIAAIDNKLKVLSNKRQIYGTDIRGLSDIVKNSPWLSTVFWLINLLIGTFLGGWISKCFF
ncbi:hypothetical protein [Enterococcus faecalis]|uniref:hypothetical protein n=1 Tax=Enterococcus faecalis TaxID=1351 RepID=UPI0019DD6D70|nr:hypothetical protein [Enterococcus faecalis]EGO5844401.1 hypothetical protein [Enterococcus faecalis]MEB8139228.1 hypothetical protein [Enterococcus faecalis]